MDMTKVKKIIGLKIIIFDFSVLINALKLNFFLKKSENFSIIVIVVFYKNNEIIATRRSQKTLILLTNLTNIRLDL